MLNYFVFLIFTGGVLLLLLKLALHITGYSL